VFTRHLPSLAVSRSLLEYFLEKVAKTEELNTASNKKKRVLSNIVFKPHSKLVYSIDKGSLVVTLPLWQDPQQWGDIEWHLYHWKCLKQPPTNERSQDQQRIKSLTHENKKIHYNNTTHTKQRWSNDAVVVDRYIYLENDLRFKKAESCWLKDKVVIRQCNLALPGWVLLCILAK